MNLLKRSLLLGTFSCLFLIVPQAQTYVTLQQLLSGMQSNYELLKYHKSLVQAKRAQQKAISYDRLPHLNTMFQATIASNNNLQGTYMAYGLLPSVTGGSRLESKLDPVSGDAGYAGLNWEAINFGEYKARENVAKSDLIVQMNTLVSTQYDLNGMASSYYIELLRQFELEAIRQANVTRLQGLKTSIGALVSSGIRPGVDSMIAISELSKSLVSLQEAQKNFAQTQVQLSMLTGLLPNQLNPDTTVVSKIISDGFAFVYATPVDTVNHPDVNLYSSLYDLSKARLKLENTSYYPKIFVDADAWMRGSSLTSSDHFNSLPQGYELSRFNYLAGLTMTYDIMNIARKRFRAAVNRYETEAAYHQLMNEKDHLNNDLKQAQLEKDFQQSRFTETKHQLDAASSAYAQQLSLYRNGLSSIIELNTALTYYIQSQVDYLDAKSGSMRSILNYALISNSFNSLVQTLKL